MHTRTVPLLFSDHIMLRPLFSIHPPTTLFRRRRGCAGNAGGRTAGPRGRERNHRLGGGGGGRRGAVFGTPRCRSVWLQHLVLAAWKGGWWRSLEASLHSAAPMAQASVECPSCHARLPCRHWLLQQAHMPSVPCPGLWALLDPRVLLLSHWSHMRCSSLPCLPCRLPGHPPHRFSRRCRAAAEGPPGGQRPPVPARPGHVPVSSGGSALS